MNDAEATGVQHLHAVCHSRCGCLVVSLSSLILVLDIAHDTKFSIGWYTRQALQGRNQSIRQQLDFVFRPVQRIIKSVKMRQTCGNIIGIRFHRLNQRLPSLKCLRIFFWQLRFAASTLIWHCLVISALFQIIVEFQYFEVHIFFPHDAELHTSRYPRPKYLGPNALQPDTTVLCSGRY